MAASADRLVEAARPALVNARLSGRESLKTRFALMRCVKGQPL